MNAAANQPQFTAMILLAVALMGLLILLALAVFFLTLFSPCKIRIFVK